MSDPNALVVYSFWRSTAAYRVRVAARLKGLDIEERFIDLDAGEQHDETFRRINPMGAVPALIEPGQPALTESLAIVAYLETITPTPPLWPDDAHGRARVQSIAETTAADIHPLIVTRIQSYLARHADFDATDWRAWQMHWDTTGLQGLETRLSSEAATGI